MSELPNDKDPQPAETVRTGRDKTVASRGRPPLAKGGRADTLGFTVTKEVKKAFEKGAHGSGKGKSEFFRLLVQTHMMSGGAEDVLVSVPRDLAAILTAEAGKRGVSAAFLLAELVDKFGARR